MPNVLMRPDNDSGASGGPAPLLLLIAALVLAAEGCHPDRPKEAPLRGAAPSGVSHGGPARPAQPREGTLSLSPAIPAVPLSGRDSSFSSCDAPVGEVDTTLASAATGAVRQPVRVRLLRCADEGGAYAFSTPCQEERGTESWQSLPDVVLADLDFDGDADLWTMGCAPEGQCRARVSDVWLYRAESGRYVYSPAFSALEELAVVPAARQVEASVSNCGCAASCYWEEVYDIVDRAPVLAARYEQLDCRTYREWVRDGDSLRVVCQAPAFREETGCPTSSREGRVYLHPPGAMPPAASASSQEPSLFPQPQHDRRGLARQLLAHAARRSALSGKASQRTQREAVFHLRSSARPSRTSARASGSTAILYAGVNDESL